MRLRAGLLPAVVAVLTACSAAPDAGVAVPGETATLAGTVEAAAGRNAPASGAAILAFAGDVHFEDSIGRRLEADPGTAIGPMADVLRAADFAMVNLETAVTTRGTPQPKRYHFRAPATAFAALRGAGVDVASSANNHALDYGVVGMRDTLTAARVADFPVVGIGLDEAAAYAPHRVTVRGLRLAVLGATAVIEGGLVDRWTARRGKPGVASALRIDRLVRAVREARRGSDLVIVDLHWGLDYVPCPGWESRPLARQLVDAGADVVVGSHSHVLRGGGWDPRGAYVDYGLGNFVFYKDGISPATESGVLLLDVARHRVSGARWIPARIYDGIPQPQAGSSGERIVAHKAALRGCTGLLPTPPR